LPLSVNLPDGRVPGILPLLDYSRQIRLRADYNIEPNLTQADAAQLIVRAEEFLEFAQQQLDSLPPDRCSNGQFFTKETGKWEFLQRLTNTQRVLVYSCLLKSAQLFPNAKPAENSVKH